MERREKERKREREREEKREERRKKESYSKTKLGSNSFIPALVPIGV